MTTITTRIAEKMRKSPTMAAYANQVEEMYSVSREELENILPDYVAGKDIDGLFVWDAFDARVWNGTKPVMGYEFDFYADCFWVSPKSQAGQKAFSEKSEMIEWAKNNPQEWEWK